MGCFARNFIDKINTSTLSTHVRMRRLICWKTGTYCNLPLRLN